MAILNENSLAFEEIEHLVDPVGARNVLYALAKICDAKADHLSANWQDRDGAAWARVARRIDKFAATIDTPLD